GQNNDSGSQTDLSGMGCHVCERDRRIIHRIIGGHRRRRRLVIRQNHMFAGPQTLKTSTLRGLSYRGGRIGKGAGSIVDAKQSEFHRAMNTMSGVRPASALGAALPNQSCWPPKPCTGRWAPEDAALPILVLETATWRGGNATGSGPGHRLKIRSITAVTRD